MHCDDVQTHLSSYLDDELTLALGEQITEHLQHCSACRTSYQTLEALSAQIRTALAAVAMPPGLETRIVASILAESRYPRHDISRWITLAVLSVLTLAIILVGYSPLGIFTWSVIRVVVGITWHSVPIIPALLGRSGTLGVIAAAMAWSAGALVLALRLGHSGERRPSYER